VSAEFLQGNYNRFFGEYQNLLNSNNYVTKRQSLKLLGEILLDRYNYAVMTKYISSPDNLKLMMTLLNTKSRNIQFEVFHVFKVFVANPNKPKPILDILLRNKQKLHNFLISFQLDRENDEQFNEEKWYLINQINELKAPDEQPTTA
jgi:calcium binding protein 39